ncbi:MAG: hypothetical protein ABIG91_00795 [Patescibacteria group bacterium]
MMRLKILVNFRKKINTWVSSHYINLAFFNTLMVILVFLHSAKYFDPFWTVTINVIFFILLIASIFLLGAGSRTFFLISLFFWLFAGFMKILGITVWAERITIYVFESFLIGVLLLFVENLKVYTSLDKIWKNSKLKRTFFLH